MFFKRSRSRRVVFQRPFRLSALDEELPPGPYSVETDVMRGGLFSFFRAKRVTTWMRVCRNCGLTGVLMFICVDAEELNAALDRDRDPAPYEQALTPTDD